MPRPGFLAITLLMLACRSSSAPGPEDASNEGGLSPTLVEWGSGFSSPLGLVPLPDRSGFFVVEKTGKVLRVVDGSGARRVVLDLSERISRGYEQGLLGLALHPKFAENARFFVNFTDRDGTTRIVEWTLDEGGLVRPGSERLLLSIEQPFSNHNGGNLVFGPDGKLWIGTGDGGSANDPHGNAQSPTSLLGKMLRLDVDLEEPKVEILARGLRNPWRYSFDARTGELYIADVGQNRWEWVHVVSPERIVGLNFGWSVVEGDGHCVVEGCENSGFHRPAIEYSHDEGCSITGGLVYRGRALPALEGLYFYSDFCTAFLRSFRWENAQARDRRDWKSTVDPKGKLRQPSAFAADLDGELYVLSLGGTIWKLVPR